jgi:hypothetical protein
VLFYDPAQPLSVVTITVLLFALSGGSAAMQGAYLLSFCCFVGPALGTLLAIALWYGGLESNIVAFLAAAAALAYSRARAACAVRMVFPDAIRRS